VFAVVLYVPCLQPRLQLLEHALTSKLFVHGWLTHLLLPGAGPSACRAREALKQAFGIGQQQLGMVRRRYSTLVVLDEIDMLLTRDHGVRVKGSWGFAQRLAAASVLEREWGVGPSGVDSLVLMGMWVTTKHTGVYVPSTTTLHAMIRFSQQVPKRPPLVDGSHRHAWPCSVVVAAVVGAAAAAAAGAV
jgi:hypothetical protein